MLGEIIVGAGATVLTSSVSYVLVKDGDQNPNTMPSVLLLKRSIGLARVVGNTANEIQAKGASMKHDIAILIALARFGTEIVLFDARLASSVRNRCTESQRI